MEELKVYKENVVKAFEVADQKGKDLLYNVFGKKAFLKGVGERIKNWGDILNETEIAPHVFAGMGISSDEVAYRKLKIIASVYNEGWTPNWKDKNEAKWFIWWDLENNCFDDVYDYYDNTNTSSRLCFKSKELALKAVETFPDVFSEYFCTKL